MASNYKSISKVPATGMFAINLVVISIAKVHNNNIIIIIKQIFIQDVHFNELKTAVVNVCPVLIRSL